MTASETAHLLVLDGDQAFTRTPCRSLTENGYNATGLSTAIALEEFLATRRAAFGPPDVPIPITISLGLATFPDERAVGAEGLLRLADQNLLRAKSDRRNRYRD